MKKSSIQQIFAVLLVLLVAGWMLSGTFILSGNGDTENTDPQQTENESETRSEPFAVRTMQVRPEKFQSVLQLRGRVDAKIDVDVFSETDAIVLKVEAVEGSLVSKGDLLCQLDTGARKAELLQAEAALEQARADYDAASRLAKRGFGADTRVTQTKAAFNAAEAGLEAARININRTEIRAPFEGVIESIPVKSGSRLGVGQICAVMEKQNPLIFIGNVSERDVGKLKLDQTAQIRLVTGETVQGDITYISPSADSETRTFKIEATLPNEDRSIRTGITADAAIKLEPVTAHKIPNSALVLNDDGQIGVRQVDESRIVKFIPVSLVQEGGKELWVNGIKGEVRIITVGQDFVVDGEEVRIQEQPEAGQPIARKAS